jgi:magnesium chelatase subunit I
MQSPTKKPDLHTLGALRRARYPDRSVKEEMRRNLLDALRERRPLFPGIVGYDATVVPELVNALLARHDLILLGLRGQAKTRILRSLVEFLDDWIPAVKGSEIQDHPFHPVSAAGRSLAAEAGDDMEIEWIPRELRYHEKLATPDVTIADLIGDVDPVKAARLKLSFSHEEAILYGLLPRANRGIFALNELPDLQPRIQVGLLNIMQEKDIQIRGFPVRLALDLCIVYSANPEDYTNRGNIITPLKDRIDSQILTHYPASIEEARAITDQEAWTERGEIRHRIPDYLRDAVERVAFEARASEYVDQSSGVSARLAITALECVISNLERRAVIAGEREVVARVSDLVAAVPAITGKIELVYEGEQEGPIKVARYLIGRAVKAAFEARLPAVHARRARKRKGEEAPPPPEPASPYRGIMDWFTKGARLELSDAMTAAEHLAALRRVNGLEALAREKLGTREEADLGPAMEFVLEGLHQSSVLAKEETEGRKIFLDMFQTMFSSLEEA